MFKVEVFMLILLIKYKFCLIGEDAEEISTMTPMKISLLDWNDWCKFQPNGFDCGRRHKVFNRFYYDIKLEDCRTAFVGDCDWNQNTFGGMHECKDSCREMGQHPVTTNLTPNVFCRFQPEFGDCDDYFPLWYFDISLKVCRGFSYSGCGGNQNRFRNAHECAAVCTASVTYEKRATRI